MTTAEMEKTELIYENPLARPEDVADWRMEGPGTYSFPLGRMRLESTGDPEQGQKSNLVFWCPRAMPDQVCIGWDFYPIADPGLAILFFSAVGISGVGALDPSLARRSGPYHQYHSGDLNALHVSYYRMNYPHERRFTTCNLRKSKGFHLVAQAGGPIPTAAEANPPYRVEVTKAGPRMMMHITYLAQDSRIKVLDWTDDGQTYGPVLSGGHIALRQMVPLIAEYANLTVHAVKPA
jgi:hypothetical protein